jgi:hypothetical protein
VVDGLTAKRTWTTIPLVDSQRTDTTQRTHHVRVVLLHSANRERDFGSPAQLGFGPSVQAAPQGSEDCQGRCQRCLSRNPGRSYTANQSGRNVDPRQWGLDERCTSGRVIVPSPSQTPSGSILCELCTTRKSGLIV